MAFSVSEILGVTRGRLVNSVRSVDTIRVERPYQLVGSGPSDIAFFFSRDFEQELPGARPGILVVGEPFVGPLEKAGLPFWESTAVVACEDPYLAMARVSRLFAGQLERPSFLGEVSPSAVVHPGACLGEGVSIAAGVVIEDQVVVGDRVVLYPGVYLGRGVRVGDDSVLFPRVTLYENTHVGARVRIHSGCVIGADGFGYAAIKEDGQTVGHEKIYHFGRVVIGDDVEIGALTAIDRGTFGDTVVERGAKIDNLCQLGHNTRVEEGAVICGGNSLAGGASVGRYALVLGICGIANRVHVGEGATVAAMTLVSKDVPPKAIVAGNPQRDHRQHMKAHAALNRLLERK